LCWPLSPSELLHGLQFLWGKEGFRVVGGVIDAFQVVLVVHLSTLRIATEGSFLWGKGRMTDVFLISVF